jgi:predicted nucleic acid-binding protein
LKVVSNASPLIILSKLGQVGLLLKLYDEVLIPREVYKEVVVNGLRLGAPDAQTVDFLIQQGHIRVADVTLPDPLPAWAQSIDAGEVEVIALAQQEKADWAIIDNAHARRAARQRGLPLKGVIGLLLEAFRQDYLSLPEFELIISNIKAQPTFWISERLCNQALAQARKEAQQP